MDTKKKKREGYKWLENRKYKATKHKLITIILFFSEYEFGKCRL